MGKFFTSATGSCELTDEAGALEFMNAQDALKKELQDSYDAAIEEVKLKKKKL